MCGGLLNAYWAPAVLCWEVSLVPQKENMAVWIIDDTIYIRAHNACLFLRVYCVTPFPPFKWMKKRSWQPGRWCAQLNKYVNTRTQIQSVKRVFLWPPIGMCTFVRTITERAPPSSDVWVIQWMDVSVILKSWHFCQSPTRKGIWKAVNTKLPWCSLQKKIKKMQLSGQCSALKCEHHWDLFCKRSCFQCSSVGLWRSAAQHIQLFKRTAVDLCIQ